MSGTNVDRADMTYSGGSIRSATEGDLLLVGVYLVDNSVRGQYVSGGGVAAKSLTLVNSALANNSALGRTAQGGAIFVSGSVVAEQSTLSGNDAPSGTGGGIFADGDVHLEHSTVAGNEAGRFGGGIVAHNVWLDHTIVANNGGDISLTNGGEAAARFSLVGHRGGTNLVGAPVGEPDANGNLIGSLQERIDPRLEPLHNYGGSTPTVPPKADSPALDAGDATLIAGVDGAPLLDQRGSVVFDRIADGDADGASRIDMGAAEAQTLTLQVDNADDGKDGDDGPGELSLREALQLANANRAVDVIHFRFEAGQPTVIRLTQGELVVAEPVQILGPGADWLIVDASGNDPTPDEDKGDGSRGLLVQYRSWRLSGATEVRGLSFVGGDVADSGGGILAYDRVTLSDVALADNYAAEDGGGVRASYGLELVGSKISGNRAGGLGGGVYAVSGPLIMETLVAYNSAGRNGGGVYTLAAAARSGEPMRLLDSTLAGNSATGFGGGAMAIGESLLQNATLTDNSAGIAGGALHCGAVRIAHSTIVDNRAGASNGDGGIGGGLFVPGGWAELDHAIVAENFATGLGRFRAGVGYDIGGYLNSDVTARYSLIGHGLATGLDASSLEEHEANGNLIGGVNVDHITPHLGPLRDNGGRTPTRAPLPGSPAIDAGDPDFDPSDPDGDRTTDDALPNDQRGDRFARVHGAAVDMGAYERQTLVEEAVWIVDTAVDERDDDFSPGDLSLREAIVLANINENIADEIWFAPELDGATIELTLGELPIVESMKVDASKLARGVVIHGVGHARIFSIDDGDYDHLSNVELRNLTLTGGSIPDGSGGAILSHESLRIVDTTISHNRASYGGGVAQRRGALELIGSTVAYNSASHDGGGIDVSSSLSQLTRTAIIGNTAGANGGGVAADSGRIELTNASIVGNSANGHGGGIENRGVLIARHATIVDNRAAADGMGSGRGG
ncbi:MAG: choice-of-anchor Q domain-containing protein, partial [Planctomycetota bacterium]